MLSVLRQPRYAALSALMAVVALACIGAGTWQIARFEQKRSENATLRDNAAVRPVGLDSLLPLVGSGRAPSRSRVEFRRVRAVGTYDAGRQGLVRNRTVGDSDGFLVLTPLRTASGVVLVVRGFLAQPGAGGAPALPAPPTGTVSVVGRAHVPESRHDAADLLPSHELESINPADAARRTRAPTFDGYLSLEAGQPGVAGLTAVPRPDLSNPAGGALEPQHFAYVVQWYLFAALAVAAPFAMARAETKNSRRPTSRRRIDFDAESDPDPTAPDVAEDERRAAKLADRYGHARR